MARRYNKKTPTRGNNVIKELFKLLNKAEISYDELEEVSGIAKATIVRFRETSPHIDTILAVGNSIGYELQWVPRVSVETAEYMPRLNRKHPKAVTVNPFSRSFLNFEDAEKKKRAGR